MELPIELRNEIEKRAGAKKHAELLKAAQALSERYKNESGEGKRLVTREVEALAYSIVRMPATYGSVYSALSYAKRFYEGEIASVLDVGAGTGAACWAVSDLYDNLSQITCLEREEAMLSLGKSMMSGCSNGLEKADWKQHDLSKDGLSASADLVIASYVLNEMSAADRDKALKALWKSTDKLLLIVEPGTPEGFAQLRTARETLLAAGAHIAAPCTHEAACKIGEGDWCHFTCRIARSKLHKQLKGGEAPYEDEKFCYIAAVKGDCSHAQARILRHPYVESGRITLTLCLPDEITKKTITKKSGRLFKAARKASCGDAFDIGVTEA